MDTKTAIKLISKQAKKNKQEPRVLNNHTVGDIIRQGDLYIHSVNNDHPVGGELERKQLADGTSLGARHILMGGVVFEGKKHPDWVSKNFPLGYAFDVKDKAVITHPEHAHIEINCPGRFQVTHQFDIRTQRRVAD